MFGDGLLWERGDCKVALVVVFMGRIEATLVATCIKAQIYFLDHQEKCQAWDIRSVQCIHITINSHTR